MKRLGTMIIATVIASVIASVAYAQTINRQKVVTRNNPVVTKVDSLGSLTVGNGSFATTVDVTGLQSYPEYYRHGIPLCAMADWGWHTAPNVNHYKAEETLIDIDPGNGRKAPYALQFKDKKSRQYGASEYFRINPHRLNLGTVGLEITDKNKKIIPIKKLTDIHQQLDMWTGAITSHFSADGEQTKVITVCHPTESCIASKITSSLLKKGRMKAIFRFSYPSMKAVDDGNDWEAQDKHITKIIDQTRNSVILERILDSTLYYISISWQGNAEFKETARHHFSLSTKDKSLSFCCQYSETKTQNAEDFAYVMEQSEQHWKNYWQQGGIVDFSGCKDPRAKELERRVVISQYLTEAQCANNMPPQESGLTLNTWYGRSHLEMAWFHLLDFALFNHPKTVAKSLDWYNNTAYSKARAIALRQGYEGIRWMKMTDPWAGEAPSSVGSLLIWQQPHYIYLAEEMYRAHPDNATLEKYGKLVDETAQMMADFASYDSISHQYQIKGATAMQESMSHNDAYNQPFELVYWRYGLSVAQKWRERRGLPRIDKWDDIIGHLSPLPENDSIYLAGINVKPVSNEYLQKCRTDHPAVLAACGMLPHQPLYKDEKMKTTYDWIIRNWDFSTMWGWDFGVLAMTAARLGEPAKAVDALLMKVQKNTYLNNGHNYQDARLKLYLPGSGSLLEAIAMMCAGWDGCPNIQNPGFPQDGNWNVKWEGLKKMQ